MQIVQRPDDTGRTKVEAGIAVRQPIVVGVSRPERVRIEMRHRIGRNVVNRGSDRRLVPSVICKRTVAAWDDHAGISHLCGCENITRRSIVGSDTGSGSWAGIGGAAPGTSLEPQI